MQGGSSGIGYGLKYQVLSQSRSLFNLQLLMVAFAGEMYIGCESRHGSHQLPHWNTKPQRRERGDGSFRLHLSLYPDLKSF